MGEQLFATALNQFQVAAYLNNNERPTDGAD